MPTKQDYLAAMKASSVPAGWHGLWYITKATTTKDLPYKRSSGQEVKVPPGDYTFLYRLTDDTLYNDPPGVVVMEDSPYELASHLGFVLRAKGNVLVGGLGLGCVLRGLLLNPAVTHVTCIENSNDVLRLVGSHMQDLDRLTIIEADAREWACDNKEHFDCGWYDLWTDKSKGEPHLDLWHIDLLMKLRKTVTRQGAWAFSRQAKRKLIDNGFQWIG